jgi:SNF2 family DNA or RNA helicase
MNNIFDNHFVCVYTKKIQLKKNIEEENILFVQGIYKKIYIIDRNDIGNRTDISNLSLENIPHTWYFDDVLKYYNCYFDNVFYPYAIPKTEQEMLEEPIGLVQRYNNYCIERDSYKKAIVLVCLQKEPDSCSYNVHYYMNLDIINNIILQKREPRAHLFFSMVEKAKLEDISKKTQHEMNLIMNNTTKFETNQEHLKFLTNDHVNLKSNYQLFNYQKDDILWMDHIESQVSSGNNKINYNYIMAYDALNDFTVINDTLIPNHIDISNNIQENTFEYYGGNLISEVGLGKTLTTLCHIAKTRYNNFDAYISNNVSTCCYHYKRGRKKGQSCNKEKQTEFFCKEHENSLFIDKPKYKLTNLENMLLSQYTYHSNGNDYLYTNSSLIICPNHLCDEWLKEYYEKMHGLRVLLIVTYEQYSNLTLADILFSDVVIVSYQFLINPNYINKRPKIMFIDDLSNLFSQTNEESYTQAIQKVLSTPITCNLSLFHWKRIVLDEFHEVRKTSKPNLLYEVIGTFSSDFKWNISATPFANSIDGFLDVLNFTTSKKTRNFSKVQDWHIDALLEYGFDSTIIPECKSLFKRNKRESIQDEYLGNQITNTIHLLSFTDQERSIYESYRLGHQESSVDFLIKMCCHVELFNDTKNLIQNCKTLDEVKSVMSQFNEQQKQEMMNNLSSIENEIELLTTLLENNNNVEKEEIIKQEIANKKRQYTNLKKNYEKIDSTCRYLNTVIKNISEGSTENCPVCLDSIEENSLTILSCGHKYCWDCVCGIAKMYKYDSTIKCPHCNGLIDKNNIYRIKNNSVNESTNDTIQGLIQEVKSTKIGNIIHYLRNLNSEDKCILFSQWDHLLKKVGSILEDYNIGVINLQGTVFQKKNQIDSFKNDPTIKILMLSSNNAASGMNLTIANKIIFLEPVYGTKKYRQDIENQAIGRSDRLSQTKPIEVIRFIIKDTVEEEIINQ